MAMSPNLLSLVLSTLLVAPPSATPAAAGGWATVTVEDLPSEICAGQPLRMVFIVKQHGKTPLDGLKPTVELSLNGAITKVAASAGKSKGQYVAEVSFPAAGKWNVTVHSGFGESKLVMKPITVSQASGDTQ
jgi:hypothetical protein